MQRVSALCLASGSTVFLRWIPSEWNPSDSPSRGGFGVPEDAVSGPQDSSPWCREESNTQEEARGPEQPPDQQNEETCECKQEEKVRQSDQEDDSGEPDRGKLPTSFVRGAATLENYQPHWQDFATWCKLKKFNINHEAELDRALVQYLDVVYATGEGLGIGNYVKASVLFHRPELQGRLGLPKTQQALKGWRRFLSSQKPDADSIRGCGINGGGGQEKQQDRNRFGSATELHVVSQAWGVHQDQGVRCGETSPKGRTPSSTLGVRVASSRRGDSIEDCSMGRGPHPGFALPELFGQGNRYSYEIEEQATNGEGLWCDHPTGQPVHAAAAAEFGKSQPSSPVSPPAWGGILRVGRQTQSNHRGADQRKVGDHSISQELREGVEAQSVVRKSVRSKANRVHRGNRAAGNSFPRPALQVQKPIKTTVFLEIFSGSGRLGQSVFQSHHWPVLLWDIDFGEDYMT